MPLISLCVPTRGRPDQLCAMWCSALATATLPERLELVVRLDNDDPTLDDYLSALADEPGMRTIQGPRGLLSEMWNECWRVARADVYMHCADDIRFRTDHWDNAVVDEFDSTPDRIVFVHGDDLFQGAGLGTHGFVHRRWTDTVGYLVPPLFSCDYNDTWLTELADRIGRHRYLPGVVTEHLHPAAGKGAWDQTHVEREERGARDGVGALWASTADDRARDAAKLQAVIEAG